MMLAQLSTIDKVSMSPWPSRAQDQNDRQPRYPTRRAADERVAQPPPRRREARVAVDGADSGVKGAGNGAWRIFRS